MRSDILFICLIVLMISGCNTPLNKIEINSSNQISQEIDYNQSDQIYNLTPNPPVHLDWNYVYKHDYHVTEFLSLGKLKDGFFITGNTIDYSPPKENFWITRLNEDGKIMFEETYNQTSEESHTKLLALSPISNKSFLGIRLFSDQKHIISKIVIDSKGHIINEVELDEIARFTPYLFYWGILQLNDKSYGIFGPTGQFFQFNQYGDFMRKERAIRNISVVKFITKNDAFVVQDYSQDHFQIDRIIKYNKENKEIWRRELNSEYIIGGCRVNKIGDKYVHACDTFVPRGDPESRGVLLQIVEEDGKLIYSGNYSYRSISDIAEINNNSFWILFPGDLIKTNLNGTIDWIVSPEHLIKMNLNGTIEQHERINIVPKVSFDLNPQVTFTSIVTTDDGGLLILGFFNNKKPTSPPDGIDRDLILARFDEKGKFIWATSFDNNEGEDISRDIKKVGNNQYIIGADTTNGSWLIKITDLT